MWGDESDDKDDRVKGIANEVQYASKYAVYNTMGCSRNSQFECFEPPQLFKFYSVFLQNYSIDSIVTLMRSGRQARTLRWLKKGRKREKYVQWSIKKIILLLTFVLCDKRKPAEQLAVAVLITPRALRASQRKSCSYAQTVHKQATSRRPL